MAQSEINSSFMAVDSLFDFQSAGKSFGTRDVLQAFDLKIDRGDFVVLLGPSGCGKSTVLRLLAELEPLSQGELRRGTFNGLSFVFQDPRLLPWRTVEENVLLPFELLHQPAADPQPWLEKVGLWESRHLFPHQLSGGMRMRAALTRALITNPDVLLMDEPLGALDEVTREDLQVFIRDLWFERRCTVIFVTHSMREAVAMGERIVIMSRKHGLILHDERIDRVKDQPAELVARLSMRFRSGFQEER